MSKLLATGKTDLLEKFVSNRTRRNFKAFLAWDAAAGKVNFEFEASKYPARKTAAATKTAAAGVAKTGAAAKKAPAAKKTAAAKKTTARKPAAANFRPDAALAAVIGEGAVARTEVVKKVWDYVKAHNLQDPADKRVIVADAKLLPVFGKDRIGMFEVTGAVGKHLLPND
jgi:DNA topoisomerase-3